MAGLEDTTVEDILAEIGDEQYKQAQAAEQNRLQSILAGLAVRYRNTKESPHVSDEEKALVLPQMEAEIRAVGWAIGRLKERQQAASDALRGPKDKEKA
jgi:hypothetical protein